MSGGMPEGRQSHYCGGLSKKFAQISPLAFSIKKSMQLPSRKGPFTPPPFAHGTLGGLTAHLEVVFFPTPSPRTPGGLLGPPHTWAFLGTFEFSKVVTRRSAPEWQKDIISGPMGSRGSKIGIWALLA